jgi:hypothetical protein
VATSLESFITPLTEPGYHLFSWLLAWEKTQTSIPWQVENKPPVFDAEDCDISYRNNTFFVKSGLWHICPHKTLYELAYQAWLTPRLFLKEPHPLQLLLNSLKKVPPVLQKQWKTMPRSPQPILGETLLLGERIYILDAQQIVSPVGRLGAHVL